MEYRHREDGARGGFGEMVRALLESAETYHLVFARERDAMSLFDAETKRFLDVNEPWCALYGYTLEEARGMTPLDVNADPDVARAAIGRVAGGAPRASSPELRWHRKKDGTVFPVELACGSFQFGKRQAIYAVIRDVSARVAAEDAQRRSEARFRTLVESLPEAVIVHRDGAVIYANAAALALTQHETLHGVAALELVHPDDRSALLREPREGDGRVAIERILRRDGTTLDVEIAALAIDYEGAPAQLLLGRDVTERKALERHLVTSDRLASLGRLAAAVGHEINNPLAWMIGNLQLAQRELEALAGTLEPDVQNRLLERVGAISEGAERVRLIVRDLRTLSRDDGELRPIDLHRTLDLCAEMAGSELRHRARLVRDYQPGLLRVRGSEARLGQVFLNLIVNAAHAIPEGAVHDNEVRVRTSLRDGGVVIEVEDTGCGIAPEAVDRLFEPFFTTKAAGSGTGLGLAISHHVVSAMGGRIEVEPGASRGACFRVLLPRCEDESATEAEPARAIAAAAQRPARILIVDDEPGVARVMASCLSEHHVAIVHSGREAIVALTGETHYDVVLCDLMMGDLTGMDVYEQLARERPGLERRLVFVTGGAYTERARALLARVTNRVLEKPFRMDALREVVRSVRDAAG